jgi:light-harvesting complex 1 alpha chain
MFDPRRALVAMTAFLFVLAFTLHFIMISTNYYGIESWFPGGHKAAADAPASAPAATN